MQPGPLTNAICDGAARYATLVDQASRTTVRAEVLHLLDRLDLPTGSAIVTRRVTSAELRTDALLRGSAVIHLDLVFRSSVTASEISFTADNGIVRFAFHPELERFPIGVVLVAPVSKLVRRRAELFDRESPAMADAPVVMPYAVAASPGRLGAGAALIRAVIDDAAREGAKPRVVTFSPLTGMRARVIRLVDDAPAWAEVCAELTNVDGAELRRQLLELLGHHVLPGHLPEPARSWLSAEGRRFADSTDYGVGNFHRAMGAGLVGLTDAADPHDSDALWARAYFDYGVADPQAS